MATKEITDEIAEMQLLLDVFVSSKTRGLKVSKRRWNLPSCTVESGKLNVAKNKVCKLEARPEETRCGVFPLLFFNVNKC